MTETTQSTWAEKLKKAGIAAVIAFVGALTGAAIAPEALINLLKIFGL